MERFLSTSRQNTETAFTSSSFLLITPLIIGVLCPIQVLILLVLRINNMRHVRRRTIETYMETRYFTP